MNDSDSEFQFLVARVEKLETQNRRLKLAGALCVLSGISLLLMGAKPADRIDPQGVVRARTIEGQNFVLKDEDGHVYARFSLTPNPIAKKQNGRLYLIPGQIPGQAVSGPATLQFYDDKGDVVWTAPTKAEYMPAK